MNSVTTPDLLTVVMLTVSFFKCVFLDGGLRRLARLLVCNFRALEHGYGETESVLEALRALPIIPLADGRVVALTEEGVFFPVETQPRKSKDLIQTGTFMSATRTAFPFFFFSESVTNIYS